MKFSTLLSFTFLTYGVIASPLTSRQVTSQFLCDNGKLAVAKAEEFSKLSPTDPCDDGCIACIDAKFAQCVSGQWITQSCGVTLECAALPLLLKPGVSVTCDTPADTETRINNALLNCQGPPSKDKGKGEPTATPAAAATPTAAPTDIATIRKQNADDAESQAKTFSTLTPDSPCNPGENACIQGAFAQCVAQVDGSGKYVLTNCAAPLQCFVLPLVLKRGTSLACDTTEDHTARLDQARRNL